MRIQEGKYYRNRLGRIVGPMKAGERYLSDYPFLVEGIRYTENGGRNILSSTQGDLIEEVEVISVARYGYYKGKKIELPEDLKDEWEIIPEDETMVANPDNPVLLYNGVSGVWDRRELKTFHYKNAVVSDDKSILAWARKKKKIKEAQPGEVWKEIYNDSVWLITEKGCVCIETKTRPGIIENTYIDYDLKDWAGNKFLAKSLEEYYAEKLNH